MTAARRKQKEAAVVAREIGEGSCAGQNLPKKERQKKDLDTKVSVAKKHVPREKHEVPLPLIVAVMICSGLMWVFAFRDVFATGRPVLGSMDDAMQHFTKSTEFFENSRGWKSQQGGLSTIQSITTDENNMGGLFIRKSAGAAALAVHSQKLVPLLFQSADTHWTCGHFVPMLVTSALGNLAITAFYATYAEVLRGAGAERLSMVICSLLVVEAIVMLVFAFSASRGRGSHSGRTKLPAGKTASSVPSHIVARTVAIASGAISIIATRDLFFPGQIISAIPRDDVYLEWTNAFFHSPPPGTVEAEENGLEAPLFVGDKFVSQLLALHLLIACFYKFASAFLLRMGKDGSGEKKCKTIWKVQALGDGVLLFMLRLFAPSAKSASLDLRWHLMTLGYETFILGLYAYM